MMGINTTIVIMNDSLNDIMRDKDFGFKLGMALQMADGKSYPKDIPCGGSVRAATVIESHGSELNAVVVVGGNYGELAGLSDKKENIDVLRDIAKQHGYRLSKIPKKKNK